MKIFGHKSPKGEKDMELEIFKLVIALAVIAAIWIAAYIVIMAQSESYSALFIRSHSNYIEDGKVEFTYGVDRFGPTGASYALDVMVRGIPYHSDTFEMGPGRRERNVSFSINETSFPVKVQIILREGGTGDVYETYFWLKGVRELQET
jgi:hypothetical protein